MKTFGQRVKEAWKNIEEHERREEDYESEIRAKKV